jgi:Putative zincin peptidase
MRAEHRRDLSISMVRANLTALAIGIPIAILQLNLFVALNGPLQGSINLSDLLNMLAFFAVVIISVIAHEFIHGLTWKLVGRVPSSAISYGIQWSALTPYAHLNEPIDINVYRIGGLMPGLVLGIIPYILSLILGDGNLLWFSVIHTLAAGGDWLILWSLRSVRQGTLVEDHPSRAGCYALEI